MQGWSSHQCGRLAWLAIPWIVGSFRVLTASSSSSEPPSYWNSRSMPPKSNGKMNQNEIWNKHKQTSIMRFPRKQSCKIWPLAFHANSHTSLHFVLVFVCHFFSTSRFYRFHRLRGLEERDRTTCFAQVYRPNRCPLWIFKNRGPVLLPGVNAHRGQQARIVVPCTNRKTKRPKARDMKIRKDSNRWRDDWAQVEDDRKPAKN